MKIIRHLLALTLFLVPITSLAETMTYQTLEHRLHQLEDKAALKTLVDTFSVLADKKDVETQITLFTEDATVESFSGGKQGSSFKGHQEILHAFSSYLALFDTVYHINGQQTVELHGDRATGVSYCLVVLIAEENGKKIKNTAGVTYNDEYVRRNGEWLIAKRVSNFTWRDREEMAE